MRKAIFFFVISVALSLCPVASHAQAGAPPQKDLLDDSFRDMYTVVGFGLGGAILGLSTLSFVDEPSEHLRNIVVGGAVGVIIGVTVIAWQQAYKSKSFYDDNAFFPQKNMTTTDRVSWHRINHSQFNPSSGTTSSNSLSFSFAF